MTRPQRKFNQVVALFVAFYCEPAQLELELLLKSIVLGEVLIEVGDTGLVFVLILEDVVRGLSLGMESLSFLTLFLAECFKFGGSVENRAHHDLTCHGEACGVHLTENDRTLLTWIDLNIVTGASERLLELKLVKLGIVDILTVLGFLLMVDNMDITVALLSHGEVFSNARCALLSEISCLAFCKLLFSTASHKVADKVVFVV